MEELAAWLRLIWAGVLLVVIVRPRLTEVDCGEWTGSRIDAIADSAVWRRFNRYRSGTRIPGGESILEVQARTMVELCRVWAERV